VANKTSCKVKIDFSDPTAIADAEVTAQNAYITPSLFKGQAIPPLYMMSDQNLNVLDGSRRFAGDMYRPANVALTSNSVRATTAAPPAQATVTFDDPHTSNGIQLFFGGDVYPDTVTVTWYDMEGAQLNSVTAEVSGDSIYIPNIVENYGKIVIKPAAMRLPFRSFRLQYIIYGEALELEGERIISATVTESLNTISEVLEINTCSLEILDEEGDFDPQNANGQWRALQRNQTVEVRESVDDMEIPCGTFYTNTWSWQDHILKLEAQDAVGFIDGINYYNGRVYEGQTAGSIIADIMQTAGVTQYVVDSVIASVPIYGHMPICTCRQALQAVCFAARACCDDSRSGTITITPRNRSVTKYIGAGQKIWGSVVGSRAVYTSGVTVACKRYTADTVNKQVFKGNLPAGVSRVQFSTPIVPGYTPTVSGGTLVSFATNYVFIRMASAGECIITARQYIAEDFAISITDDPLPAGEVENIKTFNAMLYSTDVGTLAEWLRSYYTWRHETSMKIIASTERVGEWCGIVAQDLTATAVIIETMTLDLTGGFLADITARGYLNTVGLPYFTGNKELITAEDIII